MTKQTKLISNNRKDKERNESLAINEAFNKTAESPNLVKETAVLEVKFAPPTLYWDASNSLPG